MNSRVASLHGLGIDHSGKCRNLILDMRCGSSFCLHLDTPAKRVITREPTPISDSKLIRPGDVGYVRTGCFHLLFSAGLPLGERKLGLDVPRTFKQLDVGKIVKRAPLEAGTLCTDGVKTQVSLTPPQSPPPMSSLPASSAYVYSVALISFAA